jgi:hypothetical protein
MLIRINCTKPTLLFYLSINYVATLLIRSLLHDRNSESLHFLAFKIILVISIYKVEGQLFVAFRSGTLLRLTASDASNTCYSHLKIHIITMSSIG